LDSIFWYTIKFPQEDLTTAFLGLLIKPNSLPKMNAVFKNRETNGILFRYYKKQKSGYGMKGISRVD
jgi:hypothetical protein